MLEVPCLAFSLLGNVILPPNCSSNLGQCYLLTMLAVDRVYILSFSPCLRLSDLHYIANVVILLGTVILLPNCSSNLGQCYLLTMLG